MDLLTKLGIDWKLLLAQAVNFLIVLGVLYRFAYRPLVRYLDERSERIALSLREAERIERELKKMEEVRAESLAEAKRQAQEVLKAAEADAQARRQEVLTRVKAEAEAVVSEARSRFEAEREESLAAVRREAARLITQGVARVVGKLSEGQVDKKLVEDAVAELNRRRT